MYIVQYVVLRLQHGARSYASSTQPNGKEIYHIRRNRVVCLRVSSHPIPIPLGPATSDEELRWEIENWFRCDIGARASYERHMLDTHIFIHRNMYRQQARIKQQGRLRLCLNCRSVYRPIDV